MTTQHPNYQYPAAWHDPYNGDTLRLAADAAAYRAKFCPQQAQSDARLSATRQEEDA